MRKPLDVCALLSVLVGSALASGPSAPLRPADLVLTGRIVTLDPARPLATALAVSEGRIVAIGDAPDVAPYIGPATERLTLPGVGLPGLADAHAHPSGVGEQLESLDLRALSKAEIVARLAEVAARTPEGEWIRGAGWDQGHWRPPDFPTAAELDAATASHPVLLERIDGHSIWVNSKALALAAVARATPDPQGGKIVRNARGEPTGIFIDHATALVRRVVPTPTPEQAERQLRAALQQYVRWGLTSVHDAGADRDTILLYKKLLAEQALPLRVYVMVRGTGQTVAEVLARGPEIDLGNGFLTIRSFKVVLDGALGSRGAQLVESYADAPGERGLETLGDGAFRNLIGAATAKGFQVNAHAIGDRAVGRALDAFEAVGPEARRLRFRVEHASLVNPVDRPRFAKLEVIASLQPVFVGEYSRWAADRVGASRAGWVLATKSLLDAGAKVALGSDYPAADSGDPLVNLFCAVTRRAADGSPTEGWQPEERLEVDAALRGLTAGPAFAAYQENDLGALTAGRYADLTVLSGDPLTTPAERLRQLEVRMTVVHGQVAYRR